MVDGNDTIDIRRIRPDEWVELRSIRLAAIRDTPSAFAGVHAVESQWPDQHWVDAAASRATDHVNATLVAHSGDGEWVGLVGVFAPEPDGEPERAELVSMWVAPPGRRRGLGHRLVEAAAAWAASEGFTTIELWVTRGNDEALALYERCGFKVTGEVAPLPSDPCKDEIRMRAPLPLGETRH